MRRIRILAACTLAIAGALPLLPGPGWLIVAEAIDVLEHEFVWAERIMNRLGRGAPRQTQNS